LVSVFTPEVINDNMAVQNRRKKSFNKNDLIFCVLILLIPTLQFAIFYIGTNINSFALAFQRYDSGIFVDAGWTNFERVINNLGNDVEVVSAMRNSFIVYAINLIVSIPISILFAYYIFKKFFAKKFFKILLFLPSMLSLLTLCILYRYFCDQALPEVAEKLFGADVSGLFANKDTEYFALLFAFIFFSQGSSLLLYLGAVSDVPQSIMEASEIDGASNLKQLTRVVLPMIFPTIKTFFICGIAGLFSNQFNLFNFYGTGAKPEHETVGYYFYKLTIIGEENYTYVAAFGLLLSIILIPITLCLNKATDWIQSKIV